MIEQLKNKYKGANIAIIATSPTAQLYEEKEDIAIAVNGAAMLDKKYDLFMAGDKHSPERNWWLATEQHTNQDNITRIVSSYIAPFDPKLYPSKETRIKLQKELENHIKRNKDKEIPYTTYAPKISPEAPHLFFLFGGVGEKYVEKISPNQKVMYWGGTISAIALQLALITGSKEINLYGCSFNNGSGRNYFYDAPKNQEGQTNREQLKIMQQTINKVRNQGLNVNIIGESWLK